MDRRMLLHASLLAALAPLAPLAQADEALWALLQQGGHVVLLRHALTDPGVGDPPGFRLDACATQRNLSEPGRSEARRLGEALRERRVPVARLLSSPWCRCLDTARLVFAREAEVEPALGNLFGRADREAGQVAALRALVGRPVAGGNVFMVTHGSTAYALTEVSPAPAEMVIVEPRPGGAFRLAGRLALR